MIEHALFAVSPEDAKAYMDEKGLDPHTTPWFLSTAYAAGHDLTGATFHMTAAYIEARKDS